MADGHNDTPKDQCNTDRLMSYWAHGADANLIAWGTDGDFARCEAQLGRFVDAKIVPGVCANLHKKATGAWPGHAAGESKPGRGKS